ncbi:MAG: transcription antitermination factor NusB [Acidobacteriia bacterium]|nr:transcription antitermination factor NusB [Terriglobia bacterium]
MITRRKSRELGLQMLFQWDIAKVSPEEVDETFWPMREEDPEEYPFARRLFTAATTEIKRIDQLIVKHSEHWRLERMPAVDRNVLRLAIAEFLTEADTPKVVVINEALEIARRFSGPESVQFINGILDQVKKTLEGTEAESPPPTQSHSNEADEG